MKKDRNCGCGGNMGPVPYPGGYQPMPIAGGMPYNQGGVPPMPMPAPMPGPMNGGCQMPGSVMTGIPTTGSVNPLTQQQINTNDSMIAQLQNQVDSLERRVNRLEQSMNNDKSSYLNSTNFQMM